MRAPAWFRRIIGGGSDATKQSNSVPAKLAVDHNPEPEGPTLDPAKCVDTDEITAIVPGLAAGFDPSLTFAPGTTAVSAADDVFDDAARAVAAAETTYNAQANDLLTRHLAVVTTADEDLVKGGRQATEKIASAASKAKDEIGAVATFRAKALFSLRAKLKAAQRRFRELTIGLTGNPTREIPKGDSVVDVLGTIVAFSAMLALELGVNLSLVRSATDYTTSAAFSIGMALVAALTAHMAAKGSKLRSGYNDAKIECERYFERWKGIDTETGMQAHVFPPSGIIGRLTFLSHAAFISACLTVLSIRLAIIYAEQRSMGDLAGSVAFILIVLGYYIFKLWSAGRYPAEELELYHATKAEVDRLTEEVDKIGGIAGTVELIEVGRTYDASVVAAKASIGPLTDAARSARRVLARLVTEAGTAPGWFYSLFDTTAQQIVAAIEERHHGAARHPALDFKDARGEEVARLFANERPERLDLGQYIVPDMPKVTLEVAPIDLPQLAGDAWMTAVKACEAEAKKEAKKTVAPAVVIHGLPKPDARRRS